MRVRRFRAGPLLVLSAALLFAAPQAMAMPILDGGWEVDPLGDLANPASDRILDVFPALNEDGPYVYNLAQPAFFRITDQFVAGDIWTVYDFAIPILTTAFVGFATGFGDNALADAGWTSPLYSSGEVLLGVGAHSITVSGDGAGGLPARYFARIDTVPEPGTMSLLGLGLAVYGLGRRKRRAR